MGASPLGQDARIGLHIMWPLGTSFKGVLCSFIWSDLCQISPGDGICTSRISIQNVIILHSLGGTVV